MSMRLHQNQYFNNVKNYLEKNNINSVEKLKMMTIDDSLINSFKDTSYIETAPFIKHKNILLEKVFERFMKNKEISEKYKKKILNDAVQHIEPKYIPNNIEISKEFLQNKYLTLEILIKKYNLKYKQIINWLKIKAKEDEINFKCPYVIGFLYLSNNYDLYNFVTRDVNVPFEIIDLFVNCSDHMLNIIRFDKNINGDQFIHLLNKYQLKISDYLHIRGIINRFCGSYKFMECLFNINEEFYLNKFAIEQLSSCKNLNIEFVKCNPQYKWSYDNILIYNKEHYNKNNLNIEKLYTTYRFIPYNIHEYIDIDIDYILNNFPLIFKDKNLALNKNLKLEYFIKYEKLYTLFSHELLTRNVNFVNNFEYMSSKMHIKWDWDYLTKYYVNNGKIDIILNNTTTKNGEKIPWNIEYVLKNMTDYDYLYNVLKKYKNKEKIMFLGEEFNKTILSEHVNKNNIPFWFIKKNDEINFDYLDFIFDKDIESLNKINDEFDKFIPYLNIINRNQLDLMLANERYHSYYINTLIEEISYNSKDINIIVEKIKKTDILMNKMNIIDNSIHFNIYKFM